MIYAFIFSLALFVSCEKDESKETPEQIATKEKLIGDWKLISSKVDGIFIGIEDFSYLKESFANFSPDNTYNVTYKKISNGSTSTSTLSGTYTVIGLNSVAFFNSISEIKLVGETLQITSTNTQNKIQVDIFIKSDNDEFELDNNDSVDVIEDEQEDNSSDPANDYDGSELISKIQGNWIITDVDNECLKQNTIEFKTSDLLIFTQHKETFNRADLIRNNINVGYPMPTQFSASITKSYNTVSFDTEAECQFIKKSELNYTVINAQTIIINEVSQLTIKMLNDNTLDLIYTYNDEDSNEQVIQFRFIKV
ncbi:hypothetical protein JCM19274_101 [Algibacter lectus]|uniref:Lipocalin-like domain-containing protein n=3 Tax=Algibacter lectus TaxID=221126 RepID=A0A090WY81_9FLAO|nr:hypothetical protein JCM19274_101 [Algibacter lectus]